MLRLKGVRRTQRQRVFHALPQREYSKAHESSKMEKVDTNFLVIRKLTINFVDDQLSDHQFSHDTKN